MTDINIVSLIANYGFPIAVAIFLLFEIRDIRKEMMNEIHSKLQEISESQKSITETQKAILETQKQILDIQREILYLLKK